MFIAVAIERSGNEIFLGGFEDEMEARIEIELIWAQSNRLSSSWSDGSRHYEVRIYSSSIMIEIIAKYLPQMNRVWNPEKDHKHLIPNGKAGSVGFDERPQRWEKGEAPIRYFYQWWAPRQIVVDDGVPEKP